MGVFAALVSGLLNYLRQFVIDNFQISFQRTVVITSVLLQGEGKQGWVTKFAVQSSKDGMDWRYVVEDGLANENPLVFKGNLDGSSVAEVMTGICKKFELINTLN